jgi:CRP-like cAMP-binding protein
MSTRLEIRSLTVIIFNLGRDDPDFIFILAEGEVECQDSEVNFLKSYRKGEIFGMKSVLIDTPRTMNLYAKTICTCYSISVESMRKVIGNNYRGIIYMMKIKQAFSKSKYLYNIDESLIDRTYPVFSIKNFENKEVVVKAGTKKKRMLYIIIEGNLSKVK